MVALTPQRQAELRAEKALREGNTAFKPRGTANRAAFAAMKEEFEKKTQQINSHTSSEANRMIEETERRVVARRTFSCDLICGKSKTKREAFPPVRTTCLDPALTLP